MAVLDTITFYLAKRRKTIFKKKKNIKMRRKKAEASVDLIFVFTNLSTVIFLQSSSKFILSI